MEAANTSKSVKKVEIVTLSTDSRLLAFLIESGLNKKTHLGFYFLMFPWWWWRSFGDQQQTTSHNWYQAACHQFCCFVW